MDPKKPYSVTIPSIITSLRRELSKPVTFFHVKLWIFILICTSLLISLLLLLHLLCTSCSRRRRQKSHAAPIHPPAGSVSCDARRALTTPSMDRRLLSFSASEFEAGIWKWEFTTNMIPNRPSAPVSYTAGGLNTAPPTRNKGGACGFREYTLMEIVEATNGWDSRNFIMDGDCWIAYGGVLPDGTRVSVNKLIYHSVGAEEFKEEAEAIQRLTHKNVAKMIGYCIEGDQRIIVDEYAEKGSLHQWLHGHAARITPLSWDVRIHIVRGIAKASVPYEDESVVVLTSKDGVYSFGVLVTEILSGRIPADYSKPQGEVYIINWLKSMVASQMIDKVLDPEIAHRPPLKELKRLLLMALRCVDSDADRRPKMGEVIHMLEPRNLLLHDLSNDRDLAQWFHNSQDGACLNHEMSISVI
ncbi:hypothetical protein Nepgr_020219 [Nepenthes gracilis]|uniref:non-specific serine/threonine protein kinase n=1 Tax=Nepenthes gracilis TaxID=150966 RepID=A0AAD3SUK2_NEPGR|nr:hypothetical protein Nepgr_020219 [Nepenthes gracilis]